jgi:hypothetical protein
MGQAAELLDQPVQGEAYRVVEIVVREAVAVRLRKPKNQQAKAGLGRCV